MALDREFRFSSSLVYAMDESLFLNADKALCHLGGSNTVQKCALFEKIRSPPRPATRALAITAGLVTGRDLTGREKNRFAEAF
jgi:hypothetical protein